MTYFVNLDTGPRDAQLGAFTPSAGESFRGAVSSAFNDNPTTLLWDASSLYYANRFGGRRLSREDAQEQVKGAGLNVTVPESSYTQEALDIIIARQQEAASRRAIDERTPWGAGSLLRGSAQLITAATDPLNVASAFIPVISQARTAKYLSQAESLAGRAAVRGGIGAVEGATGAAILEPGVFGLHAYMQDDYNMTDSLVNLAFGSALGGVLHSGAGLVNDLAQRAATRAARAEFDRIVADEVTPRNALERVSDAGPAAHEAAFRTAVADAVQGRAPDVEAVIRTISEQQRAENFQRWFAGSKVVDAEGKPLVVYHGTAGNIVSFDVGRAQQEEVGDYGAGIYLTGDSALASGYAGKRGNGSNVIPAYVALRNPYIVNIDNAKPESQQKFRPLRSKEAAAAFTERLKAEGYDGVIVKIQDTDGAGLIFDEFVEEVVSFYPEQIKSAIGNSGRFDPNSASLTDPLDAVKASTSRQADPDQLAIGSPESSRAADERLAAASKSDELQSADEKLKEATEYLQSLKRNLELGGLPPERLARIDEALKAFDEGITDAKRLGDALEQYAICGLRQ